jgi:hypothetical protein
MFVASILQEKLLWRERQQRIFKKFFLSQTLENQIPFSKVCPDSRRQISGQLAIIPSKSPAISRF